jgi:hypothetical protein
VICNHSCNVVVLLFIVDANGIIMGEFGFITADDVYHVTVYATDENGNFKIISMKNIKLMKGPAPQPFAAPIATTSKPFKVQTTARTILTTIRPSDVASCASCSLPAKPDAESIKPPSSALDASTDIPPPFKVVSKDVKPTPVPPATVQTVTDALPQKIINQNQGNLISRLGSDVAKNNQQQQQNLTPNSRQPALNEKLNMPQFFNKNAGNSEHYNKMENLMNGLLYKFNYTTDFQGHHEQGDRQGKKEGEYYSVGRDNIKRVVSYKANEFGFMPIIRQEPLNPQDLQYYDEKNNKLRGYEFKWFYP